MKLIKRRLRDTMAIQKLNYKKKLHQHCIAIIKERIAAIVQSMENAQAAANSEEKSSAGDKYETSRAMSHLEKDMQGRQLAANQNELAAFMAIDCKNLFTTVAAGSIVKAGGLTFFIAAGLGKITFEGSIVYLISPNAPVAKSLLGKVKGNKLNFNNKDITITEVF